MYEIKDGARLLRFQGTKLASSTSRYRESTRWIEFALYRTESGNYVLARAGMSLIYHSSVCPLVKKYGLHEADPTSIAFEAVACDQCNPGYGDPILYPEKARYWALTSEQPEAIVEALYKPDGYGGRYLTKVAERLLEEASEHDAGIDQAYRIELIP